VIRSIMMLLSYQIGPARGGEQAVGR
jgi:hypothetical protein